MQRVLSSFGRDVQTTGAAGIALLVLFVGVVTNRYRFEFIPFRPHPEHLATLVALLLLGWLLLIRRTRLRLQASDLLLIAYLAVALVSALLFPDSVRDSVEYWIRMVLSVVVYFLVRWIMAGNAQQSAFRLALKALLIFGALEALYGIVSWFAYPFGLNLGVDEYPLGIRGPGGILCNFSLTMYGTLWEPNVFGSTLMLVFLVGAALFVSNEFASWRKLLGVALAIILVALGLNSSRGALLTLALGLVLIVLFAQGMRMRDKVKWAGAAAVLLLVVNVPTQEVTHALMQLPTAPGLATRAPCAAWIAAGMPRGVQPGDPEVDPDTGPDTDLGVVNRYLEGQTLASRWVTYKIAWEDFLERPVLGNGPNSFGQNFTTTAHTPGWISNLVLMALHDTGIVGTLLLLAWFVWFGWRALRAWQRAEPSAARTMVLSLAIGLLCLFVAYQVTTMLWFGLIWWLLAVLESGVTLLKPRPVSPVIPSAVAALSS